jgi:hypothetical protein
MPDEPDTAPAPTETEPAWNTDPLFESQGGPDSAADGVMAAANGVVAAWRKVRAMFSRA